MNTPQHKGFIDATRVCVDFYIYFPQVGGGLINVFRSNRYVKYEVSLLGNNVAALLRFKYTGISVSSLIATTGHKATHNI